MLPETAEVALWVRISQTFTDAVQWDKASPRRVDKHRWGTKQEISIVEQDVDFSRRNPRPQQETDHPDFPPASCSSQHEWPC